MRSKYKIYTAIVLLVSGLIVIRAYAHGGEDHSEPSAVQPTSSAQVSSKYITVAKESQFALNILTERVSTQQLEHSRKVAGKISPAANMSAEVFPSQAGRITATRGWKIGDNVAKGQPLFSIEQTLTGTERLGLERDLIDAKKEEDEATRDYQRKKTLEGVVAKKEIEFARIRLESAHERRAALERVLTQGTRPVTVSAPISGTITSSDVVSGEYVEVSKKLMEIVNTSVVWVEAQLFEADVKGLPKNTTATITSPVSVGTFTGRLITVGDVVDPATRTVSAVFEVVNRLGSLKINAAADIDISMGADVQALAVKKEAIVSSGGKQFVFLHRTPEEFEAVEILTENVTSAEYVAVTTGVQEGDRVVISGLSQLRSSLPQ